MVAEGAVVGEAALKIPVAGLALRVAVGGNGRLAALAVEHAAVALDDRIVGGDAGITLLVDGEGRVVGAFQLEAQTLGDEVQLLVQHQVHLNLIVVGLHESVSVVGHARTAGEGQQQAVGIVGGGIHHLAVDNTWAGERRSVVDVLNHTTRALTGVGLVGIVHVTCHVERDSGGLGGHQVHVGAVVEALVLISVVVGHVELLEETALGVHTGGDEVADLVRTAGDVDVMLLLQSDVLHDVVGPLRVGEADGVAAVLELLYDSIGEGSRQPVVGAHLVVEHGIVVGAGLVDHLGRCQG